MRFLLSIHDVWPGNAPLVAEYLGRLRSLGARKMALLVVPAFQGGPPMDGNGDFVAWLREEAAAGTELFLHGYRHCTAESLAGADGTSPMVRNVYGRWVNTKLVGQEAEFCGLAGPEKAKLLDLGMASFVRASLPLTGFVAPTWHGTPNPADLRDRGLGILETRFSVMRLRDGAVRRALPLTWSAASGNRNPSLTGGAPWLRAALLAPLVKVAVHPGDLSGSGAEKALEKIFGRGSGCGYGELFGERAPAPLRPDPGVPGA